MRKIIILFGIIFFYFVIINFSSAASDCIEKTSGSWTLGNCPIHPTARVEYANNKRILGNGPSPYIKNIISSNPKRDNGEYKNYRIKCPGERMVDTSDGERVSSCKKEKKIRYEKRISFREIKYNGFKATWVKDNSAKEYSYRLSDKNGKEIKSGNISENYINFDGLEQGTNYGLLIIARNEYSVLGTFKGVIKTPYSKSPLKLHKIKPSSTSANIYFKSINGANDYKLDIYRIEEKRTGDKENPIEYIYHRLGGKNYERPRNASMDCLNPNNFGKALYCTITYEVLKENTSYKARVTALKGEEELTSYEGNFKTTYKSQINKKLNFSDIKHDSFTFSWEKGEGVNKYYYDIYDKTNNKQIIKGMYDDIISYSYNTKTGKYKNWNGFPLKPSTTYEVKVNGYSNAEQRYKIVFSGKITTDGDDINILSEKTKKDLDDLILKVKNKYLLDKDAFTSLIKDIKKEISKIDLNTEIGKKSILKANYLISELEKIIKDNNYIKLENKGVVNFKDIEKDSFTINRKKVGDNDNYYIKIYDKTNNIKVISGMYEDKPLTYKYNTKTGKYNIGSKIKECTYYRVNVDYYKGAAYKTSHSDLITKGCDGVEDSIIDIIHKETNGDLCGVDLYETNNGVCTAVGNGWYSLANNNSRMACTNYPDTASRNYTYTSDGNGTNNCNASYVDSCGVGFYETSNGVCTETGDTGDILSEKTKKELDDLILKVKYKYFSDENVFTSLIENIKEEISKIDSDTEIGKISILKANYLISELEKIIKDNSYLKLRKSASVNFEDIEKDSFTINRKKLRLGIGDNYKYYIRITDRTNNKQLISDLYENNRLKYTYNTKTGRYDFGSKIKECTYYRVGVNYYKTGGVKKWVSSELITKGCDGVEDSIIDIIHKKTNGGGDGSGDTDLKSISLEETINYEITNDGFIADWKSHNNATTYDCYVFLLLEKGKKTFVSKKKINTNSIKINGLKKDGIYNLYIIGKNQNQVVSTYSEYIPINFNTVTKKLNIYNIDTDNFTFSWEPATGVDRYLYDIFDVTNNKYVIQGLYEDKMYYSTNEKIWKTRLNIESYVEDNKEYYYYNTNTGKYNDNYLIQANNEYLVNVKGYSKNTDRYIIIFSGTLKTIKANQSILNTKNFNVKNEVKDNSIIKEASNDYSKKDINIIKNNKDTSNQIKDQVIETEDKDLKFLRIKSNNFIFFWGKVEGVDRYSYDIYDKNDKKYIVKGLSGDKLKILYNTKSLDGVYLKPETSYIVNVKGYSETNKDYIVIFSGEVKTKRKETNDISNSLKLKLDKKITKIYSYLKNKYPEEEKLKNALEKVILNLNKAKKKNPEIELAIEYLINGFNSIIDTY